MNVINNSTIQLNKSDLIKLLLAFITYKSKKEPDINEITSICNTTNLNLWHEIEKFINS